MEKDDPLLVKRGVADMTIAQGVVQCLPKVVASIKEIYTLRTKEQVFRAALASRCEELNINKSNFAVLVQGLTELSKTEGADDETKSMFREMIRDLFSLFSARMEESGSFATFIDKL